MVEPERGALAEGPSFASRLRTEGLPVERLRKSGPRYCSHMMSHASFRVMLPKCYYCVCECQTTTTMIDYDHTVTIPITIVPKHSKTVEYLVLKAPRCGHRNDQKSATFEPPRLLAGAGKFSMSEKERFS